MKSFFRNIIAVAALILLVYVVSTYYVPVGQMVGVKGASTKRVDEIKSRISKDVTSQIDTAASRAGEVKISDIVLGLQRFGRIPKDLNSIKTYATEQIDNYFSKKQK